MNQTPQTSPDPAASWRLRALRLWQRAARSFLHLGFTLLSCPWFPVQSENAPKIVAGQPVIVAPNHVSYLDPPVLQCALMEHVTFMMTEEIYVHRLIGWIFKVWEAIPVPENRPPTAAMKAAIRALRNGETVVIFPEGKISLDGHLNEGHGGVGMLIAKRNVPVIPAAILGTFEVLPKRTWWPRRHRVLVRFGDPMFPTDVERKDTAAFVDRVMGEIAALGAPVRPTSATEAASPAG